MCGIAGRILSAHGEVGSDLVSLMEAQEHRGADSTGFAVYGEPLESGLILRGMGFDGSRRESDLSLLREILDRHGSDFRASPTITGSGSGRHYSFRVEIDDPSSLSEFVASADADDVRVRFEIQSCGRSLEIVKDVGGARDVDSKHGVSSMLGTHGLGHARLATESSVLPNASHPFWARPFADVAIVHNGQITNYYLERGRLERKGYRFLTANDSELIAVRLSDRMADGLGIEEALDESIEVLDGVFTYMIADSGGIGFAKDRFAMKPLSATISGSSLAAATEEQALRRVFSEEIDVINYDGPSMRAVWRAGNSLSA